MEAATPGYFVTRPGGLRAWFQGRNVDMCDVLALTPSNLWLEPATPAGRGALDAMEPDTSCGRLWVDHDGNQIGPIGVHMAVGAGEARYALPCRDPDRARLTTVDEGLETQRRLASWISQLRSLGVVSERPRVTSSEPGVERIVDRGEILELLSFFALDDCPGHVLHGSQRIPVRLAEVDAARERIRWKLQSVPPIGPAAVQLVAPCAVYTWPVFDLSQGESQIPEWISKTTQRRVRRCTAPAGTHVRLRHPRWGQQIELEREVIDLGYEGLSFRGDLEWDLLYPGLSLSELTLSMPNGPEARLHGEVRSIRPAQSISGVGRVGVRVAPATVEDASILDDFVHRTLYPSTKGCGAEGWGIWAESGYMYLSGKRPEDFRWLRDAYENAVRKLESSPEVAQIAYWPARETPQATLSQLRVSSNSWLLCHVSKRRDAPAHSRQGLRELYLRTYELACRQAGSRWLMTYVQDTAPTWSKRAHLEVPRRFLDTGEGYTVSFRALEYEVSSDPERLEAGWRVERVTHRDAGHVLSQLAEMRAPQYLDALDLTPDRWNLRANCQLWHEAGLARERELIAIHADETLAGIATIELAETGAHLYGLLDCVRLYPLGPCSTTVVQGMLSHARRWYHERGRQRFVFLAEPDSHQAIPSHGHTDLGGATLTLLAVERLGDLLQAVCNLSSTPPPPRA